jgi:hypothetical protein
MPTAATPTRATTRETGAPLRPRDDAPAYDDGPYWHAAGGRPLRRGPYGDDEEPPYDEDYPPPDEDYDPRYEPGYDPRYDRG